MPTWGELLTRLKELTAQGHTNAFDIVRRESLTELANYTGRNVILYASAHLQKPGAPPESLSITNEDIEGFMEVFYGLTGTDLDLIIHSPGGRAEATEAIVQYLRSIFRNIRVIVPQEAMSAATMLACAGDRILMGLHSILGPIDPQLRITTPLGAQSVPAQAILDQFERAKQECKQDRTNLAVWIPSLQQYGPALLQQCEDAITLSKSLVENWLTNWMFHNSEKRVEYSKLIADTLANHKDLLTHGRPLNIAYLKSINMVIDTLEDDPQLQDKVLTVYHATMHTFAATPAAKIIENQNGRAYIKRLQQMVIPQQQMRPPVVPRQPNIPTTPSSSPPTTPPQS